MINAAQCRAARGLVDWSLERLAEQVGLSIEELFRFEHGGDLHSTSADEIKRVLEGAGAVFLPERGGRGSGVRLKFTQQSVKRIDIWENEGGPAAEDDVR
jgi:hypothetical protein